MILAVGRQCRGETAELQTQLLLKLLRVHAARRELSQRCPQNGHIRKLRLRQIIGLEIGRRIHNAVGLHGMEDKAAIGLRLRRDGGRVARQVRKLHVRDRSQRFRAIRLLLERGKPLLPINNSAALRLVQRFKRILQRLAFALLPFLAAGLRRAQEDFGGMRIFQQQAAQKRLIISCADGGAQIVEHLAEAQAGGGVAAIQPAGQDLKLKDQPARHRAVIAFAELEFEARKRGLDLLTVKAVFAERGQRIADRRLNGGQVGLAEVLHTQQKIRLHTLLVAAEHHVLGKALFQNRAAQRRVVAAAEYVRQHLRGEECLRVPVCSDHVAAAELPALLHRFSGGKRIVDRPALRPDGWLGMDLRVRVDGCEL